MGSVTNREVVYRLYIFYHDTTEGTTKKGALMELMPHQEKVLDKLGNGKVLYGNVGSGKTLTSLAYYARYQSPKDVYVITTAKKRDSLDWENEAASLGIGDVRGKYGVLTVDSWNNIGKYVDVEDAFFIFDEQRLIGSGAWVKAFYKIARRNTWIVLTGTPGDVWMDYAPVFIANGYYKNLTDFRLQHVRYGRYKYPKIIGYLAVNRLEHLRNVVLIEMEYLRHTERHVNYFDVDHDVEMYERLIKTRWNPWTDEPMVDAGELFRSLRKLVNSDPSRLEAVRSLLKTHPRLIVFYNFNYELEALRSLREEGVSVLEWNGHRKDILPDVWEGLYVVQYVAGAEGWNCISTDAMVFYSFTYSYKNFMQAQGRIDRLNTPFQDLYYYVLTSNSSIDKKIKEALSEKRDFNEAVFVRNLSEIE